MSYNVFNQIRQINFPTESSIPRRPLSIESIHYTIDNTLRATINGTEIDLLREGVMTSQSSALLSEGLESALIDFFKKEGTKEATRGLITEGRSMPWVRSLDAGNLAYMIDNNMDFNTCMSLVLWDSFSHSLDEDKKIIQDGDISSWKIIHHNQDRVK